MGPLRRRCLVVGTCALFVPPFVSAQERRRLRRVAVLMGGMSDSTWVTGLRESFGQLGWIENRNVVFEYRWGEGEAALMRKHAAELVRWKPDVFVVRSATALREAQRAAVDIPIVFVSVSDPVGNGFVKSLSRPGGNTTGFSNLDYDMAGQWLQLLREVAPSAKRVLALQSSNNPNWPGWIRAIEASASALKLEVVRGNPTDRVQIEPTISAFAQQPNGGLIVLPDPFLIPEHDAILSLAKRHRLPAVYGGSGFDNGEGLIYYGVDPADFPRLAALYVDRILNGEKAGNLPVQAPTKFRLVVNLKLARTLGLVVPASMLMRADRVIE